jgi:integrase
VLGPKYQNFDLVFATAEGGPLHSENLAARNFKAILKAVKLPASIQLYDLRHSCAMLLLADGNPKVVSERRGDSIIMLTLGVYSDVLPTMHYSASERLESIISANPAHQRRTEQERPTSRPTVTC